MRFAPTIAMIIAVLALASCEGSGIDPAGMLGLDGGELHEATAADLDSLAAEGANVSVSGTVLDQYPGGELILDDGTGLIRVVLPEEPPLMPGHRLLATGTLSERDGVPLLHAREWLYDSTAVPVRSD